MQVRRGYDVQVGSFIRIQHDDWYVDLKGDASEKAIEFAKGEVLRKAEECQSPE